MTDVVIRPDVPHFRQTYLARLPRARRPIVVVALATLVWALASYLVTPAPRGLFIDAVLLILKILLLACWAVIAMLGLALVFTLRAVRQHRVELEDGQLTRWLGPRIRDRVAIEDAVRVHRAADRNGRPIDVVEGPAGEAALALRRGVYDGRLDELWRATGLPMVGSYEERLDLTRTG
jgi:hypothetical protein